MFKVVLLVTAPNWKESRCLAITEGMSKLWYNHIVEYYKETGMNELQSHTMGMNLAMLKERRHKIQYDSMYIKLKSKQNYVVEKYEGDKSKKKKNMIVTEVRMIIISSS